MLADGGNCQVVSGTRPYSLPCFPVPGGRFGLGVETMDPTVLLCDIGSSWSDHSASTAVQERESAQSGEGHVGKSPIAIGAVDGALQCPLWISLSCAYSLHRPSVRFLHGVPPLLYWLCTQLGKRTLLSQSLCSSLSPTRCLLNLCPTSLPNHSEQQSRRKCVYSRY